MSTTSPKSRRVLEKSLGFPELSGMPNTRIPQFSPYSMKPARIMHVKVTAVLFVVELEDGRSIQAPTVALLPVCDLPFRERRKTSIVDNATAIEWPAIGYKVTLRQLMGVE